ITGAGVAPERIRVLGGSFADFCRVIQGSSLYVGYDSAGQHAAAAMGVPSVTLFKGYPNERMLHRWQPRGTADSAVIRIPPGTDEEKIHGELVTALSEIL